MTITLRPHQVDAADAVEDAFRQGVKAPLVDACVGAGKSLIYAELARRALARGERYIIGAHTRELVEQNAAACRALMPGVHVGVNAAALGERTWRAPIISAAIQSIFKHAASFGPVQNLAVDEAHLVPHSESGMYRELHRALGYPRMVGGSGTVFRLQGGSLIEGEGAPFERVVYRYSIVDGIRDGYLCPAFSIGADDKIDRTRLRTSKGEYTSESSDAQMIAAMDNHIAQMVHHCSDRRAWLIFEAGTKAARAMAARMNEWGIPTGLVLGETDGALRAQAIEAYRAAKLKALVNVNALTTGFDVQRTDLLVDRAPTKSLGRHIQKMGRLLRTIGGNIEASIAAGKADGAVMDFAGNIDVHGPLDFIRPKETKARLVSCESCGKRNGAVSAKCWSCGATMTKNCPACLEPIAKYHLDCPHCSHDMRQPIGMAGTEKAAKLLDVPTGAALIASYRPGAERAGGWLPIRRAWSKSLEGGSVEHGVDDGNGGRWTLPATLATHAGAARWLRMGPDGVAAILLPNGASRSSALQITADGVQFVVPLPGVASVEPTGQAA